MKTQRVLVGLLCLLVLPPFLTGYLSGDDKKKPKNDACAGGDSESACGEPNTCGSGASVCEVDIKRVGGNSASATPNSPNHKSNDAFCVKVGTTITFKSTSKDTGFVLDFGDSSPFDSGPAIIGGADRPRSVVAKKPGCYTYSVGACTAGTVYGMCGDDKAQIIVSNK
jgi:hypothetical protein